VRLVLVWDGENDASRVADACAAGNESVTPEEIAEKVRNLWPEDPPCPPLEAVSASVEGLLLGDERGVAVSGGRASWRQTRGRGAFG
jgi:hypothetical protein